MCPQDPFGKPVCNIVPHPDRPDESFCASCQKRFQNGSQDGSGVSAWLLSVLATVVVAALL